MKFLKVFLVFYKLLLNHRPTRHIKSKCFGDFRNATSKWTVM